MALIKRTRKAAAAPATPPRLCVDEERPATEIGRTDDGWVTIQLDDGTTPTVLAYRVTPCTCAGKGCT